MKNYNGGPVGLDAICASLNEDSDTIEDMVEPYLLKIGFVMRTARGRLASEEAYKHFNLHFNSKKQFSLFGV
jgi:Holliday junction DNA helicase RuvB